MMEYLMDLNISERTYELLKQTYTYDEQKEISICEHQITSSIEYLKNIGVYISTIEAILLNDYHIFTPGEKCIKKAISKVNKEKLVEALNKNIAYTKYLKDFL